MNSAPCPNNCDNGFYYTFAGNGTGLVVFERTTCDCRGAQARLPIGPRRYVTPETVLLLYPGLAQHISLFPVREGLIDSVLAHETFHSLFPRKKDRKKTPPEGVVLPRPKGHLPKFIVYENVRYDGIPSLRDSLRVPVDEIHALLDNARVRSIHVMTFNSVLKPFLCRSDVYKCFGRPDLAKKARDPIP